MPTIGFATIAESPREDVVPHVRAHLPPNVGVVERGCLDGRTSDQIAALRPAPNEVGIVARLRAGGETLLSHARLLPVMQSVVDELVTSDGADLLVILCGADWSRIRAEPLVVNPGLLFPATVGAIAAGRRLGIVKPSAGQIDAERERYRERGIEAVVTSASPYTGEDRIDLASRAAEQLRDAGVDLVWMTCIGMDRAMRDTVGEITGRPVLLARSLLASIVAELLVTPCAVPR